MTGQPPVFLIHTWREANFIMMPSVESPLQAAYTGMTHVSRDWVPKLDHKTIHVGDSSEL
jgi:hypothetical protein